MLNENQKYQLIHGDCLTAMQTFQDSCIDCIVTSPPYWGQRIYDNSEDSAEIGNEKDFHIYIEKLRRIFREAQRILKKEGSLWVNLGDRYNSKALMGMPWRVALALIEDGWILRNDVIWSQMKGTQSCKDRLRDSYEHVFHFVKNKHYHYDGDAIRVRPSKSPTIINGKATSSTDVSGKKYRQQIVNSKILTPDEKQHAIAALDYTLTQIANGEINDFRMTIRGEQRAWHSEDTTISGRAKELEKHGFYIMKMSAKGPLPTDIWNIVPEDTWRKDSMQQAYKKGKIINSRKRKIVFIVQDVAIDYLRNNCDCSLLTTSDPTLPVDFCTFSLNWKQNAWCLAFSDIYSTSIEGINTILGGATVNEYPTEEEFISNIQRKGFSDNIFHGKD